MLSVLCVMVKDRNGKEVKIGDTVKVISIDDSVIEMLDAEGKPYVESMLNQDLQIYEIDEHGQAWVEKWWNEESNNAFNHSLGLFPHNMQRVETDR